jgi:hypothetical protein
MSSALRRQLTNLGAALTMLAILAGLTFGLPAVDASIAAVRPVEAGQPYPVGAGVTVVPPAGATVDLTRTRPAARRGSAVLLVGPVRYAIGVQPFRGTLDEAIARLRRTVTENAGYQVTGTEVTVVTDSGLTGRQGSWTAPGRGGRYAVYLIDGLAIEVAVTGTTVDLGTALPAVEASARTIRYRAGR